MCVILGVHAISFFAFRYLGAGAMGRGFEGSTQEKSNDETSLDS